MNTKNITYHGTYNSSNLAQCKNKYKNESQKCKGDDAMNMSEISHKQ